MKKLPRLLRHEFIQIVLLVLPFAFAAVWWNKFPDRVVTHWDLHNQPNGWMPKARGLLMPPAINVALCALFVALPRIDPRLRRRADPTPGQRRAWRAIRLGVSGLITAISLMILAAAVGWHLAPGLVCFNGTLILFAIIGNYLGNLEPNYLMGIRTPWTLEDTATWRATHRLGGRVMVFGSVALLVVGLFIPPGVQIGLLIGFTMLLAVGSLGYSAWFYQTHAAAK